MGRMRTGSAATGIPDREHAWQRRRLSLFCVERSMPIVEHDVAGHDPHGQEGQAEHCVHHFRGHHNRRLATKPGGRAGQNGFNHRLARSIGETGFRHSLNIGNVYGFLKPSRSPLRRSDNRCRARRRQPLRDAQSEVRGTAGVTTAWRTRSAMTPGSGTTQCSQYCTDNASSYVATAHITAILLPSRERPAGRSGFNDPHLQLGLRPMGPMFQVGDPFVRLLVVQGEIVDLVLPAASGHASHECSQIEQSQGELVQHRRVVRFQRHG
jgi:hypothetical protein